MPSSVATLTAAACSIAELNVLVERELDPYVLAVELDAANLADTDAGDLHLLADPQAGGVLDERRVVALPERDDAEARRRVPAPPRDDADRCRWCGR